MTGGECQQEEVRSEKVGAAAGGGDSEWAKQGGRQTGGSFGEKERGEAAAATGTGGADVPRVEQRRGGAQDLKAGATDRDRTAVGARDGGGREEERRIRGAGAAGGGAGGGGGSQEVQEIAWRHLQVLTLDPGRLLHFQAGSGGSLLAGPGMPICLCLCFLKPKP